MDRIDAMRVFVRVVEQRSFSRTADELSLPRATVTHAVQALEARLGARLLQRTTRHVSPTLEGEVYYERCLRLLADFEEAELLGTGAGEARGRLKVDMHGTTAAHLVVPALPEFLARHPGLTLEIGTGDRLVDLVREGVDCVLRGTDHLKDSSLVSRKLTDMAQVTCAGPAYLARHGTPRVPADLQRAGDDGAPAHMAVNFISSADGRVWDIGFTVDGRQLSVPLPGRVVVNGTEAYVAAGLAGLGLIQLPRRSVQHLLDDGSLCEVLTAWAPAPLALWALYPQARRLSPRVRVFIDWIAERLSPG